MIFKHRFISYDPKKPEISELNDSIQLAALRAEATVSIIQNEFAGGENRVCDRSIFDALDAVSMQIRDIGEIVNHFAAAQKKART